jgi:two-component system, sensor histidine kinase PdtaS
LAAVAVKDFQGESWLSAVLADWQLVADAAFSDLVLWVPNRNSFEASAHARPAAAPTLFYRDIIGNSPRSDWAKQINQAWTTKVPALGSELERFEGNASRVSAYPVFTPDKSKDSVPIAIITRHTNLGESRMPNKLKLNFVAVGEELLKMISEGCYPTAEAGSAPKRGAPRANDGLIRLDAAGRVLFASPSALSVFNAAGVDGELEGRLLAETVNALPTGFNQVDEGLPLILTGKGAWRSDVDFEGQTVSLRSVPLMSKGKRNGAIVLCRDVTQLRVRDRELISKDATIREIHHRVKNNLQTVASLLRIQSRQTKSEEVKESLAQAMRRVSAIAVVHDVLTEGVDQEVSFDQVFKRILTLVPETAVTNNTQVTTEFEGSFGELPAERSTSLALVLTEIVSNAVEHGLEDNPGVIQVTAEREKKILRITVEDNGVGLPEGKLGSGLGTQIVKTLVESELRGKINWTSPIRGGTRVVLEIPV